MQLWESCSPSSNYEVASFEGFQHPSKYDNQWVTSENLVTVDAKESKKQNLKNDECWKRAEIQWEEERIIWDVVSTKAKSYLAMKFFGPTLLAIFKDPLPANDQVELDLSKPNELA